MHVTFRELAQQMGMQTVRAILSEDIDICLNAAIIEKVRSVVVEHVGFIPANDRIAKQTAATSPINALRTLYKKGVINDTNITGDGNEVNPFKVSIPNNSIMLFTGFKVSYDSNIIYDCRLIEHEDLGQTLRDFCSRASKDSPIITVLGSKEVIDCNLYVGRNTYTKPKLLQYFYIAEPAKVYYDENDSSKRVDCDLPQYLHMEIVQRAVNTYIKSIYPAANNNKNNN